jgi:ElaB/YqjD/DUF883 family membrane-anchored ribosome-binding protein
MASAKSAARGRKTDKETEPSVADQMKELSNTTIDFVDDLIRKVGSTKKKHEPRLRRAANKFLKAVEAALEDEK